MSNDELSKYLQPVDDGLPMRDSQDYAKEKLQVLQYYLYQTITSMRAKNWIAINYLDLQAGPGKNRIGNEVVLGSPLIALSLKYPFSRYYFNEWDSKLANTLQQRVNSSLHVNRVQMSQADLNTQVFHICDEIAELDKQARSMGKWSTLNVAFLDPEGLELHWSTVERLAKINRMDLIINFSTSGLNRVLGTDDHQSITRFFGNENWVTSSRIGDPTKRRRAWIELYLEQLRKLGYTNTSDDPDLKYPDISFRNSKNAEVYSLIFASKHPLGDDFWRNARKSINQRQLGLFDD